MGRALRVGLRTQHRWGLNLFMGHVPRVAALPQPIAPKGLRLTAQGCGGHAVTLGDGICHIINPNGVAEPMDENMSPRCASGQMTDDFSAAAVFPGVAVAERMTQPRWGWVWGVSGSFPGYGVAATPGCGTESRWDSMCRQTARECGVDGDGGGNECSPSGYLRDMRRRDPSLAEDFKSG